MKYLVLMCFLSCFVVAEVQGQDPPSSKEEYEAAYKKRIQREMLYGVYIPKDLGDAFIQLNQLIDEDSKKAFKNYPEEEAARQLFFSFGRWITHNWGFYGGSRLSHFLKELGIHHPEDMARFIIITYHRNLNRNSLDVKDLVGRFQEARKQEAEEKRKDATILHEETRKRERDQ